MMKKLGNLFLQGLIAILPIAATLGILYWLGNLTESMLRHLLTLLLPDHWYVPGMGLLMGVVAIFMVGLLVNVYFFQQLNKITEKILFRIPLVKTIYNAIRDIAHFLTHSRIDKKMGTTVLVRFSDEMRVVGFITSDSVPFNTDTESVAVYLPMSYQIGGYTLYLPKSRLEPLNMSVEDAMRMVLTAGMSEREVEQTKK